MHRKANHKGPRLVRYVYELKLWNYGTSTRQARPLDPFHVDSKKTNSNRKVMVFMT